MRFIHADLGFLEQGTPVEFSLHGNQANCVLLDAANFAAFKAGRSYRYAGGLAKTSRVRIGAPRSTNWHAVVFLPQGRRGHVDASIRALTLA